MKSLTIGINASGDNPMESVRAAFLAGENADGYTVRLFCSASQVAKLHDEIQFSCIPKCLHLVTRPDHQILPLALSELRHGKINALITATNSEDLMIQSVKARLWSRINDDYSGLIVPIPTRTTRECGFSFMMDAGATSVVTDPNIFCGWARQATAFLQNQYGIDEPRIRLINISSERAHPILSAIAAILKATFPTFDGYCEPKAFMKGETDILLCDGFTGNLLMKQIEATVEYMAVDGLSDMENVNSQQEARAAINKKMSYEEHLLSPLLMSSRKWLFRLHGYSPAKYIVKAFGYAARRFDIVSPNW